MNNQIMKRFLIKELNLNKDENIKITAIGGITNKNYLILTKKMKLVLRVPGVATENFINRHNEKNNSELVFKMGINPETIYFDTISGIKITQYIPDSETFSPGLVRKKIILKISVFVFVNCINQILNFVMNLMLFLNIKNINIF